MQLRRFFFFSEKELFRKSQNSEIELWNINAKLHVYISQFWPFFPQNSSSYVTNLFILQFWLFLRMWVYISQFWFISHTWVFCDFLMRVTIKYSTKKYSLKKTIVSSEEKSQIECFLFFCFRGVNRIPYIIEVIILNLILSCYTLVTLCCQIDIIGHAFRFGQIYVGFMIDIVRLSLRRLFRMLSVLCLFCLLPNCCRVSWIMWPSACPIRRWSRWRVRSMPSCKHRRESFTTRASLWGKNWTRRSEYTLWDEWMRITWIGSCMLLSCFCSAQQESTKKGNMKRENKAYSFKEQIIELELQEVREIQQMIRSN